MSDEATIPVSNRAAQAMISAFPRAGRRVEHAYSELELAAGGGTLQQQNALGDPRLLARPWDPATCVDPQLRAEIWQWLEQVVTWLNHEYVWDADVMVPSCWPRHPHLVHELAVLADLRRRAGLALTADVLEEWHRYAVPAFTDRMRQRVRQHCQDGGHQPWPGAGRHTRYVADEASVGRAATYLSDIDDLAPPSEDSTAGPLNDIRVRERATTRPDLHLVDGGGLDTGELLD
ncbi:hypothetical protein [Pengzhenrongella phosphoraccumulans]|uniref:hypothetical protein n=1 Tax=Pengzhenrongella phosphoraccumulans TaxID=3114394 RepID=UPI00388E3FC7